MIHEVPEMKEVGRRFPIESQELKNHGLNPTP
jgi:hypothetical protein